MIGSNFASRCLCIFSEPIYTRFVSSVDSLGDTIYYVHKWRTGGHFQLASQPMVILLHGSPWLNNEESNYDLQRRQIITILVVRGAQSPCRITECMERSAGRVFSELAPSGCLHWVTPLTLYLWFYLKFEERDSNSR